MRSSGCNGGDAEVPGAVRSVELAGRDDDAGSAGEIAGGGPGVAVPAPAPTGRTRRRAARRRNRPPRSRSRSRCMPGQVALALQLDVLVVAEGDDRRGLDRAGRHQPGVLAHLAQVVHELGVAGVEADPRAGEVVPLGQRVHGEHAGRCRCAGRSSARSGPGELGVALVGEHRDAALAPPPGGGVRGRAARRWGSPASSPTGTARGRRPSSVDVVERLVRHGAAAGERRAHLVGRVADRRVEHGVARRVAQPAGTAGSRRRTPSCRRTAATSVAGSTLRAEAAFDPARRRPRGSAGVPIDGG